MEWILIIIISTFVAFLCRTIAMILSYALSYGQLLGFIKTWVARKVNAHYFIRGINSSYSQSERDIKSRELYDVLCNYKNDPRNPNRIKAYSFLLSLLDCTYCIGFWVSAIASMILAIILWKLGYVLLIPILTFYMIEKV